MLKKFKISIILLMVFFCVFCVPNVINAKTVTVTTAKELSDNLPFTTNDVTDIVLGADIKIEDTVVFYIRSDSSLDLNGYTLTVDTNYDFFVKHHCKSCTMTFKDTSLSKTGRLILKKTQIYVEPSDGNCLNTSVIIDGGNYELSSSNTEYALFNLEKSSGCSSYDTTESLLIKSGNFKANRIFFAQGKTSQVKIKEMIQERAKIDGKIGIGQFNNGLALNKLSDVIDINSEVLYDNVLENDLSKNVYEYQADNVILVKQKNNNSGVETPDDDSSDTKPGDENDSDQTSPGDNNTQNNPPAENENNNNGEIIPDDEENKNQKEENKVNNSDKTSNPKTGDNIVLNLILFIFSIITLMSVKKIKKLYK